MFWKTIKKLTAVLSEPLIQLHRLAIILRPGDLVYNQGGYTYHAGAKSVQFNTIYKKTFGVLLMPTVAPELTNKPPHMVLFNNDGVGGVKNDGFNAIAYYDVLNRDYNDNVAFFWIAVGI